MTPQEFSELALSQLEAVQSAHMGQTDFRVSKKIFATLDENKGLGTLKLQTDQQAMLLEISNGACFPANGSWGEKGWTKIALSKMQKKHLTTAMHEAWQNVAPKKLLS